MIDQSHERAERRDEDVEGEVFEGFAERRETGMKLFFTDVFDADIVQREAPEIA